MRARMLMALVGVGVLVGCGTPAGPGDAGTASAPASETAAPVPAVDSAASAPAPAAPAVAPAPVAAARPAAAPRPAQPGRPAAQASAGSGAGTDVATASSSVSSASGSVAPAARVATFRNVTVPAGTALVLALRTTVTSESSTVNSPVRATLQNAVVVDGVEVLPAGTEVGGVVSDVATGGRVKGVAEVSLQFTSVDVAGSTLDLRAEPVVRRAEASKGDDVKKVGIGAGAGAALGALLGGGSGAAKGAAIGGAAGAGMVLATKGKDVRLEPGTELRTALTAPLSVRLPR